MEIPNARSYAEDESSKDKEKPPSPFAEAPISFNFEDLREPSMRILEGIRDHINHGSYRMIIGDDASGRIPTLLFSGVIKNAYQTTGHTPAEVRFFAGDRSNKSEEFTNNLAKRFTQEFKTLAGDHGARVLVVTDTINTGAALRPLVAQLARYQIPYDIAAIGYIPPSIALSESEKELHKTNTLQTLGGVAHVGQNKIPSSVYRNPHAAGVVRQAGLPVAKRAVGDVHPTAPWQPYFGESVTQDHVNAAREAVGVLVNELSQRFLDSDNTFQ